MDGWMDGWMDELINDSIQAKACRLSAQALARPGPCGLTSLHLSKNNDDPNSGEDEEHSFPCS